MAIRVSCSLLLLTMLLVGCDALVNNKRPPKAEKDPIVNGPKMTDKIGEFDPNAGATEVNNEIHISNPITGPLEAYEPMKRKLAGLGIDHAVNLFYALEGRYPKDFQEFKQRIIDENQMRLPQLPDTMEYQYDVDNHKLVIVMKNTGKPPEGQE
ncbi:MAG: hypothetical protein KDA85_02410 [Planctomycetaceae bacterium]|nr:hypothetical protein [Planctomycetaceae bacterium]